MERTALAFSTIANLFLFMDSVTTIHISVVPKAKIVKGLFTESQVHSAVTEFGAVWVKHVELVPVKSEPANKRLMNNKTGRSANYTRSDFMDKLVSTVKQWVLVQSPRSFFMPL